jgi:hypothetical protein
LCDERGGEVMGQCRVDILLTPGGGADRAEQLGVRALLQHVAKRPGAQQFL